ncbi:MAG: hypothetical protein RLO81_14185 [Fulvivirga sp.]|uniref:hypothetical protein n=1 Tax=Fulvivirga sp. TaxID=1931237 RepID=UPI0032EE822E
MENKLRFLYPLLSLVILLAGQFAGLPLLFLICMVPLFLIYLKKNESSEWIVSLTIVLLIGNSILGFVQDAWNLGIILYPLVLGITLYLNLITRKVLRGAMRSVIVVAFWLSAHYIVLKLNPSWALFFSFQSLAGDFTQWTDATGLMGITAWVVISNIIISKSLYTPDTKSLIRFSPSVLIALLIILIPAFISLFMSAKPSVGFTDMIQLYSGYSVDTIDSIYAQRGEWLARTSAWLSVLVLIYSLVKLKTTK